LSATSSLLVALMRILPSPTLMPSPKASRPGDGLTNVCTTSPNVRLDGSASYMNTDPVKAPAALSKGAPTRMFVPRVASEY